MFTKEKYIQLKEEGKTDKEIMSLEKIDHNKLYALKKRWNLTGVKIESAPVENKPVENVPNWEGMYKQLKEEHEGFKRSYETRISQIRINHVSELKTALAEKTKAFETIVGASEKAIEENELLKKEIEYMKKQLQQPAPTEDLEELERENFTLRQCLKMVL